MCGRKGPLVTYLRGTLTQICPLLGLIKEAIFTSTLAAPDYTGRSTARIETGVRKMPTSHRQHSVLCYATPRDKGGPAPNRTLRERRETVGGSWSSPLYLQSLVSEKLLKIMQLRQ